MKKEIINYRRKRAKQSLEEARIMFENSKLFATVNRIYYSIFYEVTALLLTKGLSSSKHTGTRSMFNREFIKTGIVKEELGDFYNKMFEFRQKGDYGDFVEFEKEKVANWLEKAENFINATDKIAEEIVRRKE